MNSHLLTAALLLSSPALSWAERPLLSGSALVSTESSEEKQQRQPLPSAEEIAQLPPDGGEEFNRLVFETSPYLRQHARNPVDWYPWSPEAFEQAAKVGKPVFLSIGYSTCHWCHVMEHESFEDQAVADLMNEHFICIKVDREERPDVDQIYMTVTQGLTGGGGWPMTVVMTPEREPFFAGTYFPKASRGGRPGMMDLVPQIGAAWKEQPDEMVARAGQLSDWLRKVSLGSAGESVPWKVLNRAARQYRERFDPVHGGFSQRPKFPVPHNSRYLLRAYHHALQTNNAAENEDLLGMVRKTLTKMRRGGIWDHVGFGFHRYSVDSEWLVPHFEKMLYDQALIAMAYVEAWQVCGIANEPVPVAERALLRQTAEEIFTYVLRDMTAPQGGFYSAEDADSEGEEGLFYLWTTAQLVDVLGEEEGNFVAGLLNASEAGNFAEEASGQLSGRNILHLQQGLAQLAEASAPEDKQKALTDLEGRWEAARKRLFDHREGRIHPLKDDKILTDWNGLMIAALAKAGRAFDDPRLTQAAVRAADFALTNLRQENGRLFKRHSAGAAGLEGVINDYAFLTWGLIELHQTTQEPRFLREALELTEVMLEQCWDEKTGGFFTAASVVEDLIVRAKESYDGAIPSGNSVAAGNLLRLARLTGNSLFEDRALETMRAFAGSLGQAPTNQAEMLCQMRFSRGPSYEVVICGDPAAEDTRSMLSALNAGYRPNQVVLLKGPGQQEALTELAEFSAAYTSKEGQATAYVCQNFTCQAPTTSVETMLEFLASGKEVTDAEAAPDDSGGGGQDPIDKTGDKSGD